MDSNEALVYIQIGETVYPIVKGAIDDVLGWVRSANAENVQADNDKLDQIHADNLRRIAQAEQEAGLTPPPAQS